MSYTLVTYEPKVVIHRAICGNYDYVAEHARRSPPGIIASALSTAYVEGKYSEMNNPYAENSDEYFHFRLGRNRVPMKLKEEVLN